MIIEELKGSKKYSAIAQTVTPLTFSLLDYRNNYFVSDDPNKIIEFYYSFENREQLIQWMRERPKGVAYIQEVEGDKDIIVVILTADFNGKYAMECRENIFKGLHIVFVESGGRGDFYFNYAHNCNVGIKKAMEYNPKWVVVSNDDMLKIDDIDKLKAELAKIPEDTEVILASSPENRFSVPTYIGIPTILYSLLNAIRRKNSLSYKIARKYEINYEIVSEYYVKQKILLTIVKRFIIRPLKKNSDFIHISSFGIFNSWYVKRLDSIIFDETYINENEDIDRSYQIAISGAKVSRINYSIGDLVGRTFGVGLDRQLRGTLGLIYFFLKWKEKFE